VAAPQQRQLTLRPAQHRRGTLLQAGGAFFSVQRRRRALHSLRAASV